MYSLSQWSERLSNNVFSKRAPCLYGSIVVVYRTDGYRVFLFPFSLEDLIVSLLSWGPDRPLLLTHSWTLGAVLHRCFALLSLLTFPMLSGLPLTLLSEYSWAAQTTQLAAFMASLSKTKCCLFTSHFLSTKLIKQLFFYRAADPLVFPPSGNPEDS